MTYRDMVAAGELGDPTQLVRAGEVVQEAVASLAQNPTERLLLQSVFIRLPVVT